MTYQMSQDTQPKVRYQEKLPQKGADTQNPGFKRRSFSDEFSLSLYDDLIVETV